MEQSKVLPAVIAFVVIEAINTVVNILPATRQTTAAGRRPYFIRAGVVNFVLIVGFMAYLFLKH